MANRGGSGAAGETPRTLFIFVDGLGVGPPDPAVNPLVRGDCPTLAGWLRGAVPVDACLDVDGLPQSATGQTTLFTGVNAARSEGGHVMGFPTSSLRDIIRRGNLFSLLRGRGYACTFANAYSLCRLTPSQIRRQSVTTVMTLSALGTVRDTADLERGRAVYHDLTRAKLRERGYEGEEIEPETAAGHAMAIAGDHDFTLFEFFETDMAGHRGNPEWTAGILRKLDRFFARLDAFGRTGRELFILLSDHGNVEDERTLGHTRNPVPLVARGAGATALRTRVRRLENVVPGLLTLYPARNG